MAGALTIPLFPVKQEVTVRNEGETLRQPAGRVGPSEQEPRLSERTFCGNALHGYVLRALNKTHHHDLKSIFKSASLRASRVVYDLRRVTQLFPGALLLGRAGFANGKNSHHTKA